MLSEKHFLLTSIKFVMSNDASVLLIREDNVLKQDKTVCTWWTGAAASSPGWVGRNWVGTCGLETEYCTAVHLIRLYEHTSNLL